MLKIDLTIGALRITSDEYNYILHQCKPKTKGKDAGTLAWSVVGYYSTLNQVADAMVMCIATYTSEEYPIEQFDDLRKVESTIAWCSKLLAKAIQEKV